MRQRDRQTEGYSPEKARQGEIILRKPWQRVVFMGGLFAPFALLLLYLIFRGTGTE